MAHRESDVDIYALGIGPEYTLARRNGYLVSVSWRAPEDVRAAFRNPREAGAAVPGWREAIILRDRDGLAAALQAEARAWTWEEVGDAACDRYVAESITGWAEEVHKLVVGLERGDTWTAAIQRSLLAVGLAPRLAVHFRLLYGTENVLWEQVASCMGGEWRRLQAQALGTGAESFEDTCRAALHLYGLAARQVAPLLNADERAVVAHACRLAGYPLHS